MDFWMVWIERGKWPVGVIRGSEFYSKGTAQAMEERHASGDYIVWEKLKVTISLNSNSFQR
jgi:hypothetical protein